MNAEISALKQISTLNYLKEKLDALQTATNKKRIIQVPTLSDHTY